MDPLFSFFLEYPLLLDNLLFQGIFLGPAWPLIFNNPSVMYQSFHLGTSPFLGSLLQGSVVYSWAKSIVFQFS